jgi:hypothetical protein
LPQNGWWRAEALLSTRLGYAKQWRGACFEIPTTVSLGEVFFSIAPFAGPGSVPITFRSAGTSLTDQFGDPRAFTTVNGAITISPAIIPEPAHLSSLVACLGLLALAHKRRRLLK